MKFIKKTKNGYHREITIFGFVKFKYKSKHYRKTPAKKLDCTINISHELVRDLIDFAEDITKDNDPKLKNAYIKGYLNISMFMERMLCIAGLFDKIDKHTQILEIGSGIGTSCLCLNAFSGATVYGVEPAPLSYTKLHNCIKSFKNANPHLDYQMLNCGGENIPLPDESLDYIYSLEVLEHVQDPYKVLQEIYRLLKKGGKAYIATCNYDSFYEGHYKKFWNPFVSVEKNRRRFIRKGLSPKFLEELNFITKNKIIHYVHKTGFSDIVFNPKKPAIVGGGEY